MTELRPLWQRAAKVCCLNPHTLLRLERWAFALVALPMILFVLLAVSWPQPKPELLKPSATDMWTEPLGRMPFDQAYLVPLMRSLPDMRMAEWRGVTLPNSIPLEADVDLPDDAPKSRAWFRLQVPAKWQGADAMANRGSMGLLGNRIMGGPWAVWVNGELVQSNVSDWRIGWNVPIRVTLPPSEQANQEVLMAVAYADAKGYAVGSVFVGPVDLVEEAWLNRNFWHASLANVTGAIALVLAAVALQLAVAIPREPVYGLLFVNALIWLISGFQFTHDFTGQERLSSWFSWAVDASINWVVACNFLFAMALHRLEYPRLRLALLAYAVIGTLITLPIWGLHKNALILQHDLNLGVFLVLCLFFLRYVIHHPSREGVLLCLANVVQLVLGAHDVWALSSQTSPDEIHLFQISVIFVFAVFMYVTNRRYIQTLHLAEQHQQELQEKLTAQERLLAEQHQRMHEMVLERTLASQRDALMQDLHDRVGSNLTTGLHQLRSGRISQAETLMLLQDIGDELRHMGRAQFAVPITVDELLSSLRQRIERRLQQGGLQLRWQVNADLPSIPLSAHVAQHLRALLDEAIANSVKHAQATQITLKADARTDNTNDGPHHTITLTLTDNGIGFDPQRITPGRGLVGMRHRAESIGAMLDMTSTLGEGCCWVLAWPVFKLP